MQRDIKFDWHRFTPKDLMRLNTDRTLDIYGYILIDTSSGRYIADVQWETIKIMEEEEFPLTCMNPMTIGITISG